MPEILIGLLSTVPLTSTLSIYSLINNSENLKNKINILIQKYKENE